MLNEYFSGEIQLPAASDNESVAQEDIQIVPNIRSMPTYLTSSSNSSTDSLDSSGNDTIAHFSVVRSYQQSMSSRLNSIISRSSANAEYGSETAENGLPSFVENLWGTSSISRSSAHAEYGSEKTEDSVPSFVDSIWGSDSTATRERYRNVQSKHIDLESYEEPPPDYPTYSSEDEDFYN
jgi:hypothetical protein